MCNIIFHRNYYHLIQLISVSENFISFIAIKKNGTTVSEYLRFYNNESFTNGILTCPCTNLNLDYTVVIYARSSKTRTLVPCSYLRQLILCDVIPGNYASTPTAAIISHFTLPKVTVEDTEENIELQLSKIIETFNFES